MNKAEFDKCIAMLKSKNSLEYEEGYHWLLGCVDTHLDDLIKLMLNENNPDIRGRFVELIGASQNGKVVPLLAAELNSPHCEVRSWAYSALRYSGNPAAEKLAEAFKKEHPDEEFL